MSYKMNQQDVINFLKANNFKVRVKGDEAELKYCPYCNGGQHKDDFTFSINLVSGAYICQRASCGAKGHFVELCRDFNYELDFGERFSGKKKYKEYKHRFDTKKASEIQSDKVVEYFKGRGISKATLERYGVAQHKENKNLIVFPHYDADGILTCIKYRPIERDKGQKEFFEKDNRPILFGMYQATEFNKPLVVTEGQIDALSVVECGFQAVSVPNGCTAFTWLSFCREWLQQFKKVIVFGDWERGKMSLIDTLTKEIKTSVYAVREADYCGEKDANDILCRYGKQAIVTAVEGAKKQLPKFVIPLSQVENVNLEEMPHMKTNIKALDKVINGLYFGQVILLTGQRGEGKSTFASMLMAEALSSGLNCLAYSGELPNYNFKAWLDQQLASDSNISDGVIDTEVREQIGKWYEDRAFIVDCDSVDDELIDIIDIIEKSVIQNGTQFVLVDNLMSSMEYQQVRESELYFAQSKFVGKLKRLAKRYNIIIILIAHPRKSTQSKSAEQSCDDVSGSSDITNKVDTVLMYSRNKDEDNVGTIRVLKNRLIGKLVTDSGIRVTYNPISRQITESGYDKKFNWIQSTISEDTKLYTAEDLPF